MQKQRRSSQETIVKSWGRVPVPLQVIHVYKQPLSSSVGTKAPTQAEDGNFILNTRFLEHHHANSLLTNRKKVHIQGKIIKTLTPFLK